MLSDPVVGGGDSPTASRLTMVGVSHVTASLSLLERVSVRRGEAQPLLDALRSAGCTEAVVLSTCSRTEIYATQAGDPLELLHVVADVMQISRSELTSAAMVCRDRAAVRHLFRVAAGLESRVLGDVEIQGQTRAAFRQAQAAGRVGRTLGRLFPAALRSGAQVREETALGAQGRSLACRAVDVGLSAMTETMTPVVLVVGSGHMAATATAHLAARGHPVQVAARDAAGAARLTTVNRICPLPGLVMGIAEADLLLCATSAAAHVVTLADVRSAMAGRSRPLTVVDLSVPRNVDPRVGLVPAVRLIDVDSMHDDTAHDPALAAAVIGAEALLERALQRYVENEAARQAGPVIAALRQEVERTCLAELTRLAPGGAGDLTRLAHAVAGKLLHHPTMLARTAAARQDAAMLRLLCDVYGVGLSDPSRQVEQAGALRSGR